MHMGTQIIHAIQKSIARPVNVGIALIIGISIYSLMVLPPHLQLLSQLVRGGYYLSLVHILTSVYLEPWHMIGVFPSIMMWISLLVLMVYVLILSEYMRKQMRLSVSVYDWSHSFWIAFLSFIGYGCAACGVAVSGYLFSALGLAFISSILPFHGVEFTLLGIVIGLIGIYSLTKKIQG